MQNGRRWGAWAAAVCVAAVGISAGASEAPAAKRKIKREYRQQELGKVAEELGREFNATILVPDSLKAQKVDGNVVAVDLVTILRIVTEMVGAEVERKEEGWYTIREVQRISYGTRGDGEEIKTVIQAIALSANANVFVAPNVSGKVFMQANNIPWKQALRDAVRTAGNFAVVEEPGGVLRIVEAETLLNQVETEVFRLKYLRPPNDYKPVSTTAQYAVRRDFKGKGNNEFKEPPTVANDFTLIKALTNVLTPNVGKIDFDPASNSLIVRDIRLRIEEVRKILEELDVRPQQVYVDVNFISTSDTDFLDYGVDWGGTNDAGPQASLSGASTYTSLPYNLSSSGFLGQFDLYKRGTGQPGPATGTGTDSGNFIRDRVDSTNPHAYEMGVLDFRQVQAVLRFVKRDVSSKIVQAPKIATVDRQPATIFVGQTVRYAQTEASASQSGTLAFVIKEAENSPVSVGFQLLIVPNIIPNTNEIRLTVIPASTTLVGPSTSKPGFDTFSNGTQTIDLPRVSTRTVVTDVLLESGQAVVLGGLMDANETEEVTKLPILGDIPILEYLFKNRNRNYRTDNLLIFIRPEIVRNFKEASEEMTQMLRRASEEDKDGKGAKEGGKNAAPAEKKK